MQFLARQADFDQIVTDFLKERGDSGGETYLKDAVVLILSVCVHLTSNEDTTNKS